MRSAVLLAFPKGARHRHQPGPNSHGFGSRSSSQRRISVSESVFIFKNTLEFESHNERFYNNKWRVKSVRSLSIIVSVSDSVEWTIFTEVTIWRLPVRKKVLEPFKTSTLDNEILAGFSSIIRIGVNIAKLIWRFRQPRKKLSTISVIYGRYWNSILRISPAESLAVESGTVQMLNSSQACHWFDLPVFFKEVDRVLSPGGVVALSGYFEPTFTHPTRTAELRQLMDDVSVDHLLKKKIFLCITR